MKMYPLELIELLREARREGVTSVGVTKHQQETLPIVGLIQAARNMRMVAACFDAPRDFPARPNVDPAVPLAQRLLDTWEMGFKAHAAYTQLHRDFTAAVKQLEEAMEGVGVGKP